MALAAVTSLAMLGGIATRTPAAQYEASTVRPALISRPAALSNWGRPVFTDNFSGSKLNSKAWSIYNDPNPAGKNHPRRTKSSVRVSGGSLELIGHFQKPYGYVSGGISYNANQKYGRWVVRFRADAGAGYSPVILLWPKGKWPNDGEIDLAEVTNPERRGTSQFLHLGASNRFIGHQIPSSVNFTRWHTLAVEWLPGHVTFWLDGKRTWTVNRATGSNNYIPSSPFHLALQNDQGCDNGCKPDKNTPKQVIMRVNWVRIYSAPQKPVPAILSDPASKGVRAVAYSPDGKFLAAADGDGRTYVWTVATGRVLAALPDPASKGVRAVGYSPDGKLLATADGNGRAYVWALPDYTRRATLTDPASTGINGVAFSTGSHYVAAADSDGRTYVWTVATGRVLAALPDPASKGVRAVAYSPDGKLLATADGNGRAYVWALPDYTRRATLTDPASTGINGVAFSTGSHYVAAADSDGRTYVWTVATGRVLAALPDPASKGVRAVAYSPDGKLLATADGNGRAYVWALPDYTRRATLTDPASTGINAVAFSTSSTTLAIANNNGHTYLNRVSP